MSRRPTARLILTGDELLGGTRRDELGPRLAERLEALGCGLSGLQIVPDEVPLVAEAIRGALAAEPELTFVCGGLGPTRDDATREAVAAALGVPLELDEEALERIEARYSERGREMPPGARRQALRPEGSTLVVNPSGTAPGFMLTLRRTLLVALPGVPREFEAMLERSVLPLVERTITGGQVNATTVLHVAGVPESELGHRVAELAPDDDPSVRVGLLALPGTVELIVTARAAERGDAIERRDELVGLLRARLGDVIFGEGASSLASTVRDGLADRGWTLATAESCTGGLLGARITDLEGASEFFYGAVVAYDNRQKERLLGVPHELLERCGAVSADVACAMASGCRERLDVSMTLSVTGIAGPGGGSADKPVGLVYVGVATPGGVRAFRHTLAGDRGAIRERAAAAALDEARRTLAGLPPAGQEAAPGGTAP